MYMRVLCVHCMCACTSNYYDWLYAVLECLHLLYLCVCRVHLILLVSTLYLKEYEHAWCVSSSDSTGSHHWPNWNHLAGNIGRVCLCHLRLQIQRCGVSEKSIVYFCFCVQFSLCNVAILLLLYCYLDLAINELHSYVSNHWNMYNMSSIIACYWIWRYVKAGIYIDYRREWTQHSLIQFP